MVFPFHELIQYESHVFMSQKPKNHSSVCDSPYYVSSLEQKSILVFTLSVTLTLISTGFVVDLQHGGVGGGIKTTRFWGCYGLIFHPNQPNMVSNESWNVYPPIEYLKTILCFVVFPYHGPEVAQFERENFSAFGTRIFENS